MIIDSDNKLRVLHITEMMQAAGIESFIMNVYREIDRDKIQFDFFITRNEKEFYDDEIFCLGGLKYTVDCKNSFCILTKVLHESWLLYVFLRKKKYRVVHIHSGTPLRVFYLLAAKCAGVPMRIYHSHSAEVKGPHRFMKLKKQVFFLLRKFFIFWGTDFFACSTEAGIWMYPKCILTSKRFQLINNGIDIDKFQFNQVQRNVVRDRLCLDNKLVFGHVGRFNDQKNHIFLLEVFKEILVRNSESFLLLIGNGELLDSVKKYTKKLGIEKNVMFLGVRQDVNELLMAMDSFLLPSNYEGLPVVGVEAQVSGLPVFFSDVITRDVLLSDKVRYISLTDTPSAWASIILDVITITKESERIVSSRCLEFDIARVVYKMTNIYLRVMDSNIKYDA